MAARRPQTFAPTSALGLVGTRFLHLTKVGHFVKVRNTANLAASQPINIPTTEDTASTQQPELHFN